MILNKKITKDDAFSYHWRCEATRTTHICFVDDLLLFCGGSLQAVSLLKDSLDTFFSCSGMEANCSKSVVLMARNHTSFTDEVIDLVGYPKASWCSPHLY